MRRPHLHIGILLYICVLIGGCAGRSAPAPVVLLNSQVSDGSEEYTKKPIKFNGETPSMRWHGTREMTIAT